MPLKRILFFAALLSLTAMGPLSARQSPSAALQEWKSDKYAMFIHFGLYSLLGGVWEGKPVTRGYSEQIQAHAGIYSDVYADQARRFDPERWNPDSIALLARAAGMRSVVITSKHHDGFCMFHSAYTTFNIVDATPYGRDVVGELAAACRRHGLKFGVYFSLIDWHFPQASPISSSNSDPITPEHHAYNMHQVTELLTHYGPISEIWFDMGSLTAGQSADLYRLVHRLQPSCMVSGRLGNDRGDFCVMGDNAYPDYPIETPWQTPASMFDETWGYRSWQQRGDPASKAAEKLRSLINVVSRGGNFLLNIGPEGDGSVVPFERAVLLRMGDWLRRNGESVYGTSANPFPSAFPWGEVTARPGVLYLHLMKDPQGPIRLERLRGRLQRAYFLDDSIRTLPFRRQGDGYTISLPAGFSTDGMDRVVALRFEGAFSVAPAQLLHPVADGTLTLGPLNATPHYTISGVDYESYYRSAIRDSWSLSLPKGRAYHPLLLYSAQERGQRIDLRIGSRDTVLTLDGGEALPIPRRGQLRWGPCYLRGPLGGGLEGAAGEVSGIDPSAPWPHAGDSAWSRRDWSPGTLHRLPTPQPRDCWYLLREIDATEAQPLLLRVTAGDGVVVYLNGEMLLIHGNPGRLPQTQHLVLLPLRKGRNQLLVKAYNRFLQETPLEIDPNVPQVLYRLALPPLRGSSPLEVSWQLHEPDPARQAMVLPNLRLELRSARRH